MDFLLCRRVDVMTFYEIMKDNKQPKKKQKGERGGFGVVIHKTKRYHFNEL
jgi:hypothetical protein